jgi:coenzyme PQQ precursor peptide PqqA
MNESAEPDKNSKMWKTPTLQEIPISFEATSYALTSEDDPPYR